MCWRLIFSYLKNDIAIQKESLKAWKDFKASADVNTLKESLNSIETQASNIQTAGRAVDPATALAGVTQTVSGMAAASAPLADQATGGRPDRGSEAACRFFGDAAAGSKAAHR